MHSRRSTYILVLIATLASAIAVRSQEPTKKVDLNAALEQGAVDPYRVFPTPPAILRKTLDALAAKQFAERAKAIAAIQSPADVRARQDHVRKTLLAGLDGWPERSPLNAQIVGKLERDGYRVEKLLFESLPGFYVTANLYIPTRGAGPFPAVLGTAGHADDGKAHDLYQQGWISLAKRGFVVLAYDPVGQGERLQYIDEDTGKSLVGNGTREHIMLGMLALLTGSHVARYELWDGVRAFDYLETRPEVDSKRVAVVGNSGGGTQSAYLNAVEPRLATAVPSCYITSWRHMWDEPGPQDAEQVFPGFLANGLDFADFLTSYAPRPVKMLTAIQDFFPIVGAREAFAETKGIYKIMGAEEKAGYFEFDDTHGWSQPRREATYSWLDRWLYNRERSDPEPGITIEKEADLWVTEKGQVLLSRGGRSLQQILRERADAVYAERRAASLPGDAKDEFRDLLRSTLRMLPRRNEQNWAQGRIATLASIRRNAYRIEKAALPVDEAAAVPALLFRPDTERAGGRAIVYLDDRGKAAEAGETGLLGALAKAGHTVMAVDLRGVGELGLADSMDGYSPLYRDAMRALLVGTTLAGIQTGDLLAVLNAAQSLDVADGAWKRALASNGNRVTVIGKGNSGWIALFAAALDDRIAAVAAEESLLSYMDIMRSPRHYFTSDIVVPGVLKQFDLPDLVATLADRNVLLLNTRSPMEFLHSRESVRHEYTPARIAFLNAGHEEALDIRKENEDLRDSVYADWLR